MKRSTLIHLSLIALCSLCCAVSSMAQSFINHGSLCRVFFIKYGEATATAFTIEVHDEQFLVTAKHAVPNITKGAEISVFNRNDWLKLKVTPIFPGNDSDIVALSLPHDISPRSNVLPTMGGIAIGQDVFFLGFPFGLFTPEMDDTRAGYPIPFVKKAIVSAVSDPRAGVVTVYLDGINNPGFSGGPVIFQDLNTKELKVGAVISAYRPQPARVVNRNLDTGMAALGNSGIIITHSIHEIIPAIEKFMSERPLPR